MNSRFGVGLALGLGRTTPPQIGYRLATFLADLIASRRNSSIVKATRVNQWVVSQDSLSGSQLDQVVKETLRHTARCLFDLYHHLPNLLANPNLVQFNSRVDDLIAKSRDGKISQVITGVHMSNFDFLAQAAFMRGIDALVIGVYKPGKGYEWQNRIRKNSGFDIMPASMSAMRTALKHLQKGGSVITGMDRPIPGTKYHPRFFGRPASLPVHHIHLALQTDSPVTVVGARTDSNGTYQIVVSDPIYMQRHANRHTEIIENAETVLRAAEDIIRPAPYQWAMFYPVWPEAEAELPTQ